MFFFLNLQVFLKTLFKYFLNPSKCIDWSVLVIPFALQVNLICIKYKIKTYHITDALCQRSVVSPYQSFAFLYLTSHRKAELHRCILIIHRYHHCHHNFDKSDVIPARLSRRWRGAKSALSSQLAAPGMASSPRDHSSDASFITDVVECAGLIRQK